MKFLDKIHSWNRLTEILSQYFHSMVDSPVRKEESLNIELMLEKMALSNQDEKLDDSQILEIISNYLEFSTRTSHPLFNNQLQAGPRFEALLGEIISFISSTTMATYELAPVATLIESKLIEFINEKIGFKDGSGIMLTGGSNANLQAILCARNNLFPETKNIGNGDHGFAVYVSCEAHYSFFKAMNILGLGSDNLFTVDVDERGRMSSSSLRVQIDLSLSQGLTPLMVASTCGTTVRGAFDPLNEIQQICSEYKVWHHADAAWGGLLLFDKDKSPLLEGIDAVDSVTFDAHKGLGAGLIASFILTRDKNSLLKSNSGGGSEYLFHDIESELPDTGLYSLQCGRKVDALKVWLVIKSLGKTGLEGLVEKQKELASYFHSQILKNERLKLFYEPEYLNVCFQVIPEDEADIDEYNLALRNKMIKEGRFFVNYAKNSKGSIFFRMSFANHETEIEHIDSMIKYLTSLKL